jgi:hypothetical protein
MVSDKDKIEYDKWYFTKNYIKKNGRDCAHLLIPGTTGAGKTTALYWVLEAIVKYCMQGTGSSGQHETVVWFDTMKSDEALTLLLMAPVRFLVLPGCKLDIKFNPDCKKKVYEHEIKEMRDGFNPWFDLREGWINVLVIKPYLLDPIIYSVVIKNMFKNLIFYSRMHKILSPLAIFIDEFQRICPSDGHYLNNDQKVAAIWIEENIQMIRSLGIRLIAVTHQLRELRKSVRSEFLWQIPKLGTYYAYNDAPRLAKYNADLENLNSLSICYLKPGHRYSSNPGIGISYYPRGEEVGTMDYGTALITDIEELMPRSTSEFSDKPLPCDSCSKVHEKRGSNLICVGTMRILDIVKLTRTGCTKKELKA